MALQFSVAVRNGMLDAIETAIGATAVLRIRTGGQPATCATAESGAVVFSEWVFATTPGHTILLDVFCDNGIYVGYDATLANVSVTVAYS